MKYSPILLSILAFTSTVSASTSNPTDAELNDWMAYLKSVSLPVTIEVCSPLLAGKASYSEIAKQWLDAHADEIQRGHDFAVAGTPKGRDFDQYYAAMLADFKQTLTAKPDDAKLKVCNESLEALQKSDVRPGGT
jgi:hypothetical protein